MGPFLWVTSFFAFVSASSPSSSYLSYQSYPSRTSYYNLDRRYKSPFLEASNYGSGSRASNTPPIIYVYPTSSAGSSMNPYSSSNPKSTISSSFRSIPPSNTQLMSSPSIVSASQIPFFFGRKKGGKGQSIVRGKPVTSPKNASSSSDGIDWSSDDMMQHPIDESPRKSNRPLGQPCSYSSDCDSGCCLLDRSTKIRSCQPLARQQERCTNSQVKGDLYVDACPCESGSEYCSVNQRCSW